MLSRLFAVLSLLQIRPRTLGVMLQSSYQQDSLSTRIGRCWRLGFVWGFASCPARGTIVKETPLRRFDHISLQIRAVPCQSQAVRLRWLDGKV